MAEGPSFIFGNTLNNDFLASLGFVLLTNLSATSSDAQFPVDNLRDDKVTTVWRTSLAAGATITANYDPGQNHNIASLAIINHNLTSSATLTIQSSDETDFSVISSSTTFNPGTTSDDFFTPTGVSVQTDNWRLIINDPTNPDGFIEIGELWFSEAHVEFIESYNFGFPESRERLQTRNTTRSGNTTIVDFGERTIFSPDWTLLPDAAADQILDLHKDTQGGLIPFLFLKDPTKSEVFEVRMEVQITDTLTSFGRHSISGVRFVQEVGAVSLKN